MGTAGCSHNVGVKTWHLNTYYISSRNVSQISTQVIAALVKHFFYSTHLAHPCRKRKQQRFKSIFRLFHVMFVGLCSHICLSLLIIMSSLIVQPLQTHSLMNYSCVVSVSLAVRGQGEDLPHTALNTLTHTYIQREREFSHPSWGGRECFLHTHHTHKTVYASVWFLLYQTWSWN